MKKTAQDLVLQAWQKKNALFYLVLTPLSWLFGLLTWLRRLCYKLGIFRSYTLPVPVIVVGNISLGGTGKTPVVMWLVEQLRQKGYRPGVVSRGYGANVSVPTSVNMNSQAKDIGDEPLLIAKRCACPVFVSADRVAAGKVLLNAHPECNVIICDDGLQHYRLKRTFEIAVVPGKTMRNACLLPAGTLRESASRLDTVDVVIFTGQKIREPSYEMQLKGAQFYNLADSNLKATAADFANKNIKAVAGIGNPERFFDHLKSLGLTFAGMGFKDHHAFTEQDLAKLDCDVLLMTEKDAVKCQNFAQPHFWVLPVEANIDAVFLTKLLQKIAKK